MKKHTQIVAPKHAGSSKRAEVGQDGRIDVSESKIVATSTAEVVNEIDIGSDLKDLLLSKFGDRASTSRKSRGKGKSSRASKSKQVVIKIKLVSSSSSESDSESESIDDVSDSEAANKQKAGTEIAEVDLQNQLEAVKQVVDHSYKALAEQLDAIVEAMVRMKESLLIKEGYKGVELGRDMLKLECGNELECASIPDAASKAASKASESVSESGSKKGDSSDLDMVMDKAMDKAKEYTSRIRSAAKSDDDDTISTQGCISEKFSICHGTRTPAAAAAKRDDDTISTQGCISEKFSICHGTRTPDPAAAATTMSNDPNHGGATKHDNILLELEILDDDALELILNELKREIRNFRGRTQNGNIIILDDKRRPEEGEIKHIWRLFKVFKMLKIKRREDNYVKKADTALTQVGNNSNSMHKKKEKRKKPPAVNDFNCSDRDIKFQFVKLK